MKNRVEQIREEIIDMILSNEYDFIGIKQGYTEWAAIEIEVGGLYFEWSLHIEMNLISEHSFDLKLGKSKRIEKVAKHLIKRHYKDDKKDLIKKKIKELQDQLKS